MSQILRFKELVVDVHHFPREGIVFKDITPLLESGPAFKDLIQHMGALIPKEVTKIVSIESRGFILGAALAAHTGRGLVLCRKPGKLPRETIAATYQLEYGEDSLELHKSSLNPEDHILIVDDVLATGGTAQAAAHLCQSTGAKVSGLMFLVELDFLKGRAKLSNANVQSILRY